MLVPANKLRCICTPEKLQTKLKQITHCYAYLPELMQDLVQIVAISQRDKTVGNISVQKDDTRLLRRHEKLTSHLSHDKQQFANEESEKRNSSKWCGTDAQTRDDDYTVKAGHFGVLYTCLLSK